MQQFKPQGRLWQGEPLPPYLLVICMYITSSLLISLKKLFKVSCGNCCLTLVMDLKSFIFYLLMMLFTFREASLVQAQTANRPCNAFGEESLYNKLKVHFHLKFHILLWIQCRVMS